jgi:hypothetical protein
MEIAGKEEAAEAGGQLGLELGSRRDFNRRLPPPTFLFLALTTLAGDYRRQPGPHPHLHLQSQPR